MPRRSKASIRARLRAKRAVEVRNQRRLEKQGLKRGRGYGWVVVDREVKGEEDGGAAAVKMEAVVDVKYEEGDCGVVEEGLTRKEDTATRNPRSAVDTGSKMIKRRAKSKRIPLYQSRARPPTPSPSFCFVCVNPLPNNSRRKVTENDCFFLLKNLLELPSPQSRYYLDKMKEPEKLIGFCSRCLRLIREAAEVKMQLAKLEKDLKRCQKEVVGKMKATKLRLDLGIKARENPVPGGGITAEQRTAVENILRFVQCRKYGSLFDGRVKVPPEKPCKPVKGPDKKKSKSKKLVDQAIWRLVAALPPPQPFRADEIGNADEKIESAFSDELPIPFETDNNNGDLDMNEDLSKDPLSMEEGDTDSDNDDNEPLLQQEPKIETPFPCRISYDVAKTKTSMKRRRRKQKFSSSSNSDEETLLPDTPYPNERVTLPIMDEDSPAVLEPASKIVPRIKPKTIIKSVPSSTSGSGDKKFDGDSIPAFKLSIKRVAIARRRKSPVGSPSATPTLVSKIVAESVQDGEAPERVEGNCSDNPEIKTDEAPKRRRIRAPMVRPRYDCPACPNVNGYKINRMMQHLAIHQRRPYKCTVCSTLLPSDPSLMDAHWKEKHSNPTTSELPPTGPQPQRFEKVSLALGKFWKCNDWRCNEGFASEEARNDHELNCPLLNQRTSRPIPSFNAPHPCKICSNSSRNMDEWRLHRVINHPEVDRLSCLCCDISFAEKTVNGGGILEARNDEKMLEHIKKDHLPYEHLNDDDGSCESSCRIRTYEECEPCGLVFPTLPDSQIHFRDAHGIPVGEKIFFCPMSCGHGFKSGFAMRKHIWLHHFPKDLSICDVCGMGFKTPNGLAEHKLREHATIPEGLPVLKCPVEGCPYQTTNSYRLGIHSQAAHEDANARNFICKDCGKTFTTSSNLKHHEAIHENKESRPYKCDICGNSFAVRNYLYIHKRLSHEGRTFPSTNRKRGPRSKATN